ncbi:MAG: hypothetical protein AAGA21_02355 [Pseudomonadota bacterium]
MNQVAHGYHDNKNNDEGDNQEFLGLPSNQVIIFRPNPVIAYDNLHFANDLAVSLFDRLGDDETITSFGDMSG